MPMDDPVKFSVIMDADEIGQVDARCTRLLSGAEGRSAVVRRDLGRQYALYERELADVRKVLTTEESVAIADAMNGWASSMEPAWHLLAEFALGGNILSIQIEDSIRLEGLAARHGIDGPALVQKLRVLPRSQWLAIVDAVERWWGSEPRDLERILYPPAKSAKEG